jgi:hypothetical protein
VGQGLVDSIEIRVIERENYYDSHSGSLKRPKHPVGTLRNFEKKYRRAHGYGSQKGYTDIANDQYKIINGKVPIEYTHR